MSIEEKIESAEESMRVKESKRGEPVIMSPDAEDATNIDLENELLNHLIKTSAVFKSQQKVDPDLSDKEKMTIARSLLSKSHCLFLSKFGQFLKPEHMQYFDKGKEDYQVAYHINRLQRYFNNSTRKKDVKNRRYQALKTLIKKGEYFSECEMMKRNPLLYEQLVGQYMTEKQKKARDNLDTTNITFVNLLMESMERDCLRKKQKMQEEQEYTVTEENDSSDGDDNDDDDDDDDEEYQLSEASYRKGRRHWGEDCATDYDTDKAFIIKNRSISTRISENEKQLLKQEFITNMYQSFLNGNDIDFDYSTVDDNETYDNIDIRTQDEEEKYFDSESPETATIEDCKDNSSDSPCINDEKDKNKVDTESEDELDIYMKSLKDQVATKIISLDSQT